MERVQKVELQSVDATKRQKFQNVELTTSILQNVKLY